MHFKNSPKKPQSRLRQRNSIRPFSSTFTAFVVLLFIVSIVFGAVTSAARSSFNSQNYQTEKSSNFSSFETPQNHIGRTHDDAHSQLDLPQERQEKRKSEILSSPVFARFEALLDSPINDGGDLVGAERLAKERLALLSELAELDAFAALSKALSDERLAQLPAAVAAHVERRLATRGDYLVFAVDRWDAAAKQIGGGRTERFVRLNDRQYRALVFGRRLEMTTKHDVPLSGIILNDETIVVDEQPAARRLSPTELIERRGELTAHSNSNFDSSAAATTVAAEVGGKLVAFASGAEFDEFVRAQLDWEASINPHRSPAASVLNKSSSTTSSSATGADAGAGAAGGVGTDSVWTEGAKSVLVLRVDFADRAGDPVDHYNQPLTTARAQALFGNEVAPFYQNNSYNKTSLAATVTPVLRLPQPLAFYATGSNFNAMLADARTVARAQGYETNNFHLDLVMFAYVPQIPWAGIAAVGAKSAMLNGSFYMAETAHELGHNYGLLHANLWRSADPASPIGVGSNVEYGDCYDTMGACVNGNATRHFNARYKRLLDWLTDSEVQNVTQSGTYRIYAHDANSGSLLLRALKIRRNDSYNYWIEFRQLIAGAAQNGALVRWDYASRNYLETQLLDMAAATSTTADAPLLVGQTFEDAGAQIRITVLGKGNTQPESLDIRVELSGGGSTPTPTPTPTPSSSPTPTATPSPTPTNYTLIASPSVVAAGGQITVSWTAPAGASSSDWIALYRQGASNYEYGWWQYTNGAASGNFTLAAPAQAGQYEFRYLVNNGYTSVAVSNPVTVQTAGGGNPTPTPTVNPTPSTTPTPSATPTPQPNNYSLTAAPGTVSAGSQLTVSWTAPAGGTSSSDWIALYRVGASNYQYGWWQYTGGATTGSFVVTAPSEAGQYEFRYLVNNGYASVAASNTVTVQSAGGGGNPTPTPSPTATPTPQPTSYSLAASPSAVTAGGQLIVTWTAPAGSSSSDWIGLYRVGASNHEYGWWQYTGGAMSGSYTLAAPSEAGQYEFRYLVNNGYASVATSNTVTVQTIGSPTPTPTANPTPSTTPTPNPTPSAPINVAAAANGGVASASSVSSGVYLPSAAINGSRTWAVGAGWRDGTPSSFPDWLEVSFNGTKSITEIDVYAARDDYGDPAEPTATETFSLYGITDFEVQYWTGSAWTTVPGGFISENNLVWRRITFATPVVTDRIRVVVNNAQAYYSRIVELEAWGNENGYAIVAPTTNSNDKLITNILSRRSQSGSLIFTTQRRTIFEINHQSPVGG